MSDADALPDRVRRMWGLTSAATSPRAGLTVARVVDAAVAVADADGLEAVSMSRVASELGFTTMALYRHVANKDELLELMLDAAAGPPPELAADDGWRAATEAWTWAQLGSFRRHPWMGRIPVTGPPIGPHQVAWMEAGLRALRGSGLSTSERFGLIDVLAGYIHHEGTFVPDMARHRGDRSAADAEREYGRQLAAVIDPDRFPELSALLAVDAFDGSGEDVAPDAAFSLGVALLLDGVELLVARRADTD